MDSRLCKTAFLGLLAGLIWSAPAASQQNDAGGLAVNPANSGDMAVLRALDKVTTQRTDLEIPVGESVRFGSLDIRVDYCRSRPPEEQPESFILLTVTDRSSEREAAVVFDGWMLATLPALNPLQHPVYDLWAIGCRMPWDREKPKDDDAG